VLPGRGGKVRIDNNTGTGILFDRFGKPLGRCDLNKTEQFVSFMHNVDCEILRDTSLPCELIDFSDALVQSEDVAAAAQLAVLEAGSDVPEGDGVFTDAVIAAFGRLADNNDAAVAEAARALRYSFRGSQKKEWNVQSSLIRWARRGDEWTTRYPAIPSYNGFWKKIDNMSGAVAAARSLGYLEGQVFPRGDDVECFALRMQGHGTGVPDGEIVAVAVFENHDIRTVIKNKNPERRPNVRISRDIQDLINEIENSLPASLRL